MNVDIPTTQTPVTMAGTRLMGREWFRWLHDFYVAVRAFFDACSVTQAGSIRLTPLSAAPASPAEGEIYHNSTNHHLYVWNGAAWKQVDN